MADIIDSIMRISHEFRSNNLEPPDLIVLKSHDQGMRLLSQLHQMALIVIEHGSERGGKAIEHPDGSAWMQVEIYGMKVCWPAMKLAKPSGGYVWV